MIWIDFGLQGESIEPSAAKNAAPRYHGMQSLGKVPSARRPPANLPSLKAETVTPADQTVSWTGPDPPTTITTSSKQSSSSSQKTASSAGPPNAATKSASVLAPAASGNRLNSSSTTSTSVNGQGTDNFIRKSNSTSSSSTEPNFAQSKQSPSGPPASGSSSSSWSSVTTGAPAEIAQPPIYQSPQFQHEFPSLDGAPPAVAKPQRGNSEYSGGNGGGHNNHPNHQQIDDQNISLRPHGDAANWMHQQTTTGLPALQLAQDLQLEPPQVRALMPSFMFRGGSGPGAGLNSAAGGGGGGSTPQSFAQQGHHNKSHANNNNHYGSPHQPNQAKHRYPQQGGHIQQHNNNYNDNDGNNYNSHRRDDRSAGNQYHQQQQHRRGPPQSQQSNNRQQSNSARNPEPFVEPDEIFVPRPIINEEELMRMDSLTDDDGWGLSDEIDYNKKIVFSDDELENNGKDNATPKQDKKQQQQQQRDEQRRQDEENRNGKNGGKSVFKDVLNFYVLDIHLC